MVRLVGLEVERSKDDRQAGDDPSAEFADRRVTCDGKIRAAGETRPDPGGLVFRIGMISRCRPVRAGLRYVVVVIRVMIVVRVGPSIVVRHRGMDPLVRQSGHRRRDH